VVQCRQPIDPFDNRKTPRFNIFDEAWRVLRGDGCLWVNLANTYNIKQGKKGSTNAPDGSEGSVAAGGRRYADSLRQQPEFFKHFVPTIGRKSEMGVPFRFHLAMSDSHFRKYIGASDGPQWSIRVDREEQFASDFEAYARLESAGEDFDYVLVTNEFDAARLTAACERRRQNSPLFSPVVHI